MRRPLVSAGLAVVAAVAMLGGLIAIGQHLRGWLKDDPRYQFPFSETECSAPPGMSREAFLGEVRYLADLPEHLSLLDDRLSVTLAEAFSRHGWVESVERVDIGPGRHVRAQLSFRAPVLVVSYGDRPVQTRAVDRHAVLLPPAAAVSDLPRLAGLANAPAGRAGQSWGDSRVDGAARIAGALASHRAKLRLSVIELRSGEYWLRSDEETQGPQVIWGHAPGLEIENEASARQKLQKLLDHCARHGGLDRPDPRTVHDVRTTEK